MTHTPGPWEYDGIGGIRTVRGWNTVEQAKQLAWLEPNGDASLNDDDGDLIAAAPALLEALEKCLPSVCQAVVSPGAMFPKKECGKCGYCLGKAAIAKAKGE